MRTCRLQRPAAEESTEGMTEEFVRKWATGIVANLITLRDERLADYWAWEMTCLPFGLPPTSQLADGVFCALFGWPFAHMRSLNMLEDMNAALEIYSENHSENAER